MEIAEARKIRSILVPLDGSTSAEHALPAALSLARRHGAALYIVRVYVPVAGVYGEHAMRYDGALDRALMRRTHDYVEGLVARLAAIADVQIRADVIEGPVAEAIARHTVAVGADLLVMTTLGRGPLARFWLGSISDALVRQAGIPILFVRPQPEAVDVAQERTFRRVLIPLDGSKLAERVMEPALALAGRIPTVYTLLRVITPVTDVTYGPGGGAITGFQESLAHTQGLEKQESKLALEYLDGLAETFRALAFAVGTRVVPGDRPAATILEEASTHRVDLIALATHGWGGLKRLVLGGTGDKVLRGA